MNFLETSLTKIVYKINNLDIILSNLSIKIKLNLYSSDFNSNLCMALVENNIKGCSYQCTRKKNGKFFCGLHTNRKSNFKCIEKKKISCREFIIKLNNEICDKDNLLKLWYNCNIYYLNNKNNSLYIYDINNKLSHIGHRSDFTNNFQLIGLQKL